jgi:hypothetical protein
MVVKIVGPIYKYWRRLNNKFITRSIDSGEA